MASVTPKPGYRSSHRRALSYLECLVALGDSHGFAHTV
jgi:hypothetical protein